MSLAVVDGFDNRSNSPLDVNYIVPDVASLATLRFKHKGMSRYVLADQTLYILQNDLTTWKPLNVGEALKRWTAGTYKYDAVVIYGAYFYISQVDGNTSIPGADANWLKILGAKGDPGNNGAPGKDVYQTWLDAGNVGTVSDFIASLKGDQGDQGENGKSLFQLWKEQPGNEDATELDFYNAFKGEQGPPGDQGEIVVAGEATNLLNGTVDPTTEGSDGDFYINTATRILFGPKNDVLGGWPEVGIILTGPKGDKGDQGDQGEKGDTGNSAYEEAVLYGFVGTEEEWLLSLKGEQGETGPQGPAPDTSNFVQKTGNQTIAGNLQVNAVLDKGTGHYFTDSTGAIKFLLRVDPTNNQFLNFFGIDATGAAYLTGLQWNRLTKVFDFKAAPTINGVEIGTGGGGASSFAELSGNARDNADLNEELTVLSDAILGEIANRADADETNLIEAKAYADLVATDVLRYAGQWDASGGTYPTNGTGTSGGVRRGDTFEISVAGTIDGNDYEVGDQLRAKIATPGQVTSNWNAGQTNVQQATTAKIGISRMATTSEAEAGTNPLLQINPVNVKDAIKGTAVGATSKTTLIDADTIVGSNSESSWTLFKTTLLNLYNYLKAKFDSIYSPKEVAINTQTGSYTLVLSDATKLVQIDSASANNLTIPNNSTTPFPIGTQIIIHQLGTGQTTLVPSSGVTVLNRLLYTKITGQYGLATIIKIATNTWTTGGDMT